MKIERTFSVIKKELKGSKKLPSITMKSEEGDKLTLNLDSRDYLDSFAIYQKFQVKIVDEQQILDQ